MPTADAATHPGPPNNPPRAERLAGVTIPLFSLRGPRSWGIGEIGDLPAFAAWVRKAGIRLIQILPLGEISGGETSPYSALSAFGIDPLYISLADVPDLGCDVQEALDASSSPVVQQDPGHALLGRVRQSHDVDYHAVRAVKKQAFRLAFDRFFEGELPGSTPRALSFRWFCRENAAWLDDFALFRALKDAHEGKAFWSWGERLRDRNPRALSEAHLSLSREVLYHQYLQWIAHTQWYEARARLRAMGVEIMGDLPFMVGRDSADVWAHQGEFRDDASVGVPPDAFNEEGQDWGLPPYDWRAMAVTDFAWLRRRSRYVSSLYDRFRIDHLVGFYRTYMRQNDRRVDARGRLAPGFFDPDVEPAQLAHGERVISAMVEAARESGAELIAEDLGTVPAFVRRSLSRLGVAGYRVLIWEKDDNVFRDPASYPPVSVACFGTHDTAPVAVWWEGLGPEEREGVRRVLRVPQGVEIGERFTPSVHRALVEALCNSGSDLVLLMAQDLLGTRERINTPATVGNHNWSYRLPATSEDLGRDDEVRARMEMVRSAIENSGRKR